jgi:hypothetical protein
MITKPILEWLLDGDAAIQFQVYRDLLDKNKPSLRNRIETEGWGLKFLKCRQANGHWGRGFYQPKWTSTHYTLLDLKLLNIRPNPAIRETLQLIIKNEKGQDGGVNPSDPGTPSDVCINGMFLNYACHFEVKEQELYSVIDFLLTQKMGDGGFNCHSNRKGAVHSSLHTTLSVLEGIHEYQQLGYGYRLAELKHVKKTSIEFILMHHLFRSDHTGNIINTNFLKLCYPGRWYYDILKALDYMQAAGVPYDRRMDDALDWLYTKRTDQGLWKLASKHPGQTHFEMEQAGKPSRWNTLRALRVFRKYPIKPK